MAFNEWNTSGELTYTSGDALTAANLNDCIDETTPPIGAIIAWAKSLTGVPATLPSGWVECNGQSLSDADSPLNGQTIPNLNASGGGTQRFLRGATTSGTTGGADSHIHTASSGAPSATEPGNRYQDTNTMPSLTHTHAITVDSTATLPSYYQVVWIMRVK